MKNFKKLMPLLLAIVMVVSMATTAFAAQGVNTNTGTGSITITNAESGKTYDIYRMFDLTGADTSDPANGEFDLFSYTINPNWESFFIGGAGAGYLVERTDDNAADYAGFNTLTHNGKTYFMNITDDNVADLAQAALPYAVSLTNTDGTATASSATLAFSNIALGYYLVYPQGATDISEGNASLCSLTTTKPAASVTQKATYPDIEKDANDYSVEVGQTVTFTVEGQVPDTTGYTSYTYKVSDAMTAGLTFSEAVAEMTVKFGSTTITVPDTTLGTTLTYADNGFVLTFDMTKYQTYKGQDITITYKAIVNDAAVCNITENSATLEYSNDPNDSTSTVETPPDVVQVYSSQIVVDKVNGNDEKLENAKFVLVKKDGTAESFYKYTPAVAAAEATDDTPAVEAQPATVTWYTLADGETLAQAIAAGKVTEVTTDENGAATFAGLEDGIYYLRETVAPAGYNLLDSDVECAVEHDTDEASNKPVGVSLVKTIQNTSGTILPGTGGIGTTIFYIAGGVLLIGAAILLITRKRMRVKE